ncbi:hypothetical protein Tco_1110806 [Tanacetum coccineum]|uniref:Uncharacterized protein n=1 Tax=Tanacetum coccineum TaxID=301880 RepID=A0ABQ5ILZ2_9ASTR
MTTPRPTPFPATTPRAGVFAPFVIISDYDDEITTLPIRPAPPSPNRALPLYGYPLDYGDDSSDKDLSETTESLHTQTASTSVVHPPPTQPIPTIPAFDRRPRKEISVPLGYRAAMDRWRAASPSTLSPSPLPSPPPEHIKSVGDDIETLRASLASAMQEMMTLRARVGSSEQHDVVTRESLRIARGRITRSQLRVEYAKQEVRKLREFQVTDRFKMVELQSQVQDIEASFWDLKRYLGS